jgi:hypothetical protein
MLVNNVGVTSLTPPLFIEMPVPSQGSERSWIVVVGFDFASFDVQIRLNPKKLLSRE